MYQEPSIHWHCSSIIPGQCPQMFPFPTSFKRTRVQRMTTWVYHIKQKINTQRTMWAIAGALTALILTDITTSAGVLMQIFMFQVLIPGITQAVIKMHDLILLTLSYLQQICSRWLWKHGRSYNNCKQLKTLWKKKKFLVSSNFSFCHNVFESHVAAEATESVLIWEGLTWDCYSSGAVNCHYQRVW